MYIIDKATNKLTPIEQTTFKSLKIKERKDLQEWIVNTPNVFGEELLIIQKEFDGFNDTKERLDLLALDKNGNIVVIENKLDDSGRNVVWQVLKYASYCSQLTITEIKDIFGEYLKKINSTESMEDIFDDFFEGEDYEEKLNSDHSSQRIIMVSGDFRREVTSTVMWLLTYGLKVQCFKASVAKLRDDVIFDMEQIIPMKAEADYWIGIAKKKQAKIETEKDIANRHVRREAFWTEFIKEMNKHNDSCSNITPSKDCWIGIALGISGISVNLVITKKYVRSEIYINRGTQEENKRVFDYFLTKKSEIQKIFGGDLIWERMDSNITSRIKHQMDNVNVFNKDDWNKMIKFLIDSSTRMHKAFRKVIPELRNKL